jgi:hypothetical protein
MAQKVPYNIWCVLKLHHLLLSFSQGQLLWQVDSLVRRHLNILDEPHQQGHHWNS